MFRERGHHLDVLFCREMFYVSEKNNGHFFERFLENFENKKIRNTSLKRSSRQKLENGTAGRVVPGPRTRDPLRTLGVRRKLLYIVGHTPFLGGSVFWATKREGKSFFGQANVCLFCTPEKHHFQKNINF